VFRYFKMSPFCSRLFPFLPSNCDMFQKVRFVFGLDFRRLPRFEVTLLPDDKIPNERNYTPPALARVASVYPHRVSIATRALEPPPNPGEERGD